MHILKILICSLLSLFLAFLVPACITIERVPQTTQPPPSQPGLDEQNHSFEAEPVIESFIVNPSLISFGETATLSWTVAGADSISIAPGIGQVDPAGTMQVSPGESTAYTLTAANSVGSINRTIEVIVQLAQNGIPPGQGTFAVIEVVIATEPSSGYCSEILYADITTNDAGTVIYRWESAGGGGFSSTFSEIFTSAGTQRVTLVEEMRSLPSGMYQIHVMSPNDVISDTTHYTTCAP